MAGPSPRSDLYKISWRGLIGTEEEFVYSRWATSDTSDDQENVVDEFTGDVTDMLATTVTLGGIASLGQLFPSYVSWTELKCSPWEPSTNKLRVDQTPAYRTLTDAGVGAASAGLPYQSAVAMTTRSAASGRRKYNRFYLPTIVVNATDGHGVLGQPVADALVLWLHLNITSHDASGLPVAMVNWNPVATGGSISNAHTIVDIYLGGRVDTIRRRRNKAPEPRTVDTL